MRNSQLIVCTGDGLKNNIVLGLHKAPSDQKTNTSPAGIPGCASDANVSLLNRVRKTVFLCSSAGHA